MCIRDRRERGDDIGLITQDYLAKKTAQISDEALQKLNAYTWPGNVRELQNVLERAAILAGGKPITCLLYTSRCV